MEMNLGKVMRETAAYKLCESCHKMFNHSHLSFNHPHLCLGCARKIFK